MTNNIFHGAITALVTPFSKGQIDLNSFEKILSNQAINGIKTVVIAGSTGEVTTLEDHEYESLIAKAVKYNKNLHIVAGCNNSSTHKAVKVAQQAEKLGADALMITIPSYNRPTMEGVFRHFKSIHDATDIPIIMYSVPKRTGTDFDDATIYRLCELERIVAFKDAGGDLERPMRLKGTIGDKISLLSGDDAVALGFNAQGGVGVISVASNLIPKHIVQIQELWKSGKCHEAIELQIKLLPFYKAIFSAVNPTSIKYAMHVAGLCSDEVRLPLCELTNENKKLIEDVIKPFL
jgi:4-hydroxy-tetrahydrodipicolinate synthase